MGKKGSLMTDKEIWDYSVKAKMLELKGTVPKASLRKVAKKRLTEITTQYWYARMQESKLHDRL